MDIASVSANNVPVSNNGSMMAPVDNIEALEALEYRSCPQRDCNINLKLNYKSPVVF